MTPPASFYDRVDACLERISPAEQCVARFFQENREEVLIASASEKFSQCEKRHGEARQCEQPANDDDKPIAAAHLREIGAM